MNSIETTTFGNSRSSNSRVSNSRSVNSRSVNSRSVNSRSVNSQGDNNLADNTLADNTLANNLQLESKLELVAQTFNLRNAIGQYASQYHHSGKLISELTGLDIPVSKSRHQFTLHYGIKDLLLAGALTHSSVLMTGDTDLGKTTLARLVLNSLFGQEGDGKRPEDGWHRIDIDVDSGKDMYLDYDFSVLDGKKSSEGFYLPAPYLFLAGLIVDELNRSPPKFGAKLIHVFDRDISLPDGQRIKIGYEYDTVSDAAQGRRLNRKKKYQYQIAAINEGSEYSGTFDIDQAMRRRTLIEIPMNTFPLTSFDRSRIRAETSKEIEFRNTVNKVSDVVYVYATLDKIKLHPNASLFLAYLESFDYCENSITKSKGSVSHKGGSIAHICMTKVHSADSVCHLIKAFENELCPYIRAITPGISKNLISVAKGLALIRAVKFGEILHDYAVVSEGLGKLEDLPKRNSYDLFVPQRFESSLQAYLADGTAKKTGLTGKSLAKEVFNNYVQALEVTVEDIEAIFPFVGYSKIGLSPAWVAKHYQGSKFEAVKSFISQAKTKFEDSLEKMVKSGLYSEIGSGLAKDHRWNDFEQHCKRENPWLLQAMEPILKEDQEWETYSDLEYLYK